MAIGFSSDSSNGGNSGHDDGSLTVAQIRAPSTPFSSDTDPFNDFHFSGREDVVTVKDVEEIVEAVKSSFAKFIEVQRSYLDRQQSSNSSSTDSSESKNSSSAESNQASSQPSNSVENDNEDDSLSKGLTEAVVSDIIEAVSERNELINSKIQDSIADLKNGITSKLDSISNRISEKLIESSSGNEDKDQKNSPFLTTANSSMGISSNDMFMSFVEFMTVSNKKIENKVDGLQESLNSITDNQKNIENSVSSSDKENISTDSQSTISTEINPVNIISQENKDILGRDNGIEENIQNIQENESLVSKIGDYFDSLFSDVGKIFSSNDLSNEENNESQSSMYGESSLSDVVNENNRLKKILKTDIDGMSKSIGVISNDGIAKSMVEMMVQNSMIQMVASNTVEGMTSMMSKRIDEKFGDIIRIINESNKTSLTNKTSDGEISSSSIDSNSENSKNDWSNGQSIDDGIIKTGKPETVNITKNDKSSILNKNETSGSQSFSVGNGVDSNSKKESENNSSNGEVESKKNGLFGFIEDAFNSFVSLFNTENTKRIETVKNENNVNSSIIAEHDFKNMTSQPVIAAPSIERDSQDNTQIQIVESDKVENENNDNINSLIFDKEESINRAIARMHLNDESTLRILDASASNVEDLLSKFENQLVMIREQDRDVEGLRQLGDVTPEDLLKFYMSGREERMASYVSNMTESSIADVDETNTPEVVLENQNIESTSEKDNIESEINISELGKAIKENREYNGKRFDMIESMLKNEGQNLPPQMIYMNSPTTSFEVNRIG